MFIKLEILRKGLNVEENTFWESVVGQRIEAEPLEKDGKTAYKITDNVFLDKLNILYKSKEFERLTHLPKEIDIPNSLSLRFVDADKIEFGPDWLDGFFSYLEEKLTDYETRMSKVERHKCVI
jgi:hypothetical protein